MPCYPSSFSSSSLNKTRASDSLFLCLVCFQCRHWCIERSRAVAVVKIADVIVCLIGILLFVSQGAVIGIDDEDDSTFTITVDQKTFHFQGELKEEILSLHSSNSFHFLLGCLLNEVLQLILHERAHRNVLDEVVLQAREGFVSAVDTDLFETTGSDCKWRLKF